METTKNLIEVTNLVKRYDKTIALDHINLTVSPGEILGLLGPNGSGKTTVINCLLSLLSYDQGEIKLFGELMSPQKNQLKKRIGVVPQDVAIFWELSVYENIDYFCGLYITNQVERKKLVAEAIDIVQLEEFKNHLPRQLSGGLRRRLNIACGIAHKPDLIFFDEPTVAVDPQSRNNILESIQQLNQRGATIVYTSHYMEEIEQLCSTIMILDKGSIIASGTKEELKRMIQTNEKLMIELPSCPPQLLDELSAWPGVLNLSYEQELLTIDTQKDKKVLLNILHFLEKQNLIFGSFYSLQPTLNDVFLEITGKELRD